MDVIVIALVVALFAMAVAADGSVATDSVHHPNRSESPRRRHQAPTNDYALRKVDAVPAKWCSTRDHAGGAIAWGC